MTIALSDITPIGLCVTTQDLFDAKRYQQNYCDNLLLRAKEKDMEPVLIPLKREINSLISQKKFLDGHKAVIVSNIDKILGLVSTRYTQLDFRAVQSIVNDGKELIKKVILAENFNQISSLEPTFRSKITLPTYSLFIESMKRSSVSVV